MSHGMGGVRWGAESPLPVQSNRAPDGPTWSEAGSPSSPSTSRPLRAARPNQGMGLEVWGPGLGRYQNAYPGRRQRSRAPIALLSDAPARIHHLRKHVSLVVLNPHVLGRPLAEIEYLGTGRGLVREEWKFAHLNATTIECYSDCGIKMIPRVGVEPTTIIYESG